MLFAYFVSFAGILGAIYGDPIISIDQGQLNGTVLQSRGDKPFYAFYAIPYAQPPIGKLRFAPPQKPPSWQGIRDATQKAPVCTQCNTFGNQNASISGQEDCLYLSVFTPQINPEEPLPVLVYIHGGAFHVGSGDSRGPHYFMDKPIVVVTMNYRLGIFGFLSAANNIIPGNYGQKDQVAALKWVKSNIANFGGDPTSVTLMGQSSGSVSVHLHTMSPLSKGLFHRVIMESGSGLAFWSHYNSHYSKISFNDAVQRVNCTRKTTIKTLQCLKRLPAHQLALAEEYFLSEKQIVVKFRPAVEKSSVKNAFLVNSPFELRYQNSNIPWIVGFNSAEAIFDTIFFLKKVSRSGKNITNELRAILPYALHYEYFTKPKLIPNVTNSLMQFYFKNEDLTKNDSQKICNLLSDITFGMPTLEGGYNYSGSRYFYYFDYQRNDSPMLKPFLNTSDTDGIKGAAHGEELISLLSDRRHTNSSAADLKLSEQMIAWWTNFVISGNPNSPDDYPPHWDAFHPDIGNYLHIANDEIVMREQLLPDRYAFWKTLTKRH